MIKRSYFIRAKLPHNDGTGLYSWWSGVMVIPSWFELKGDDIFNAAMYTANDKLTEEMGHTPTNLIEIESLNRI